MAREPSDARAAVRVEVLGPLRLLVDGRPVDVPGPKRRAVLALLVRARGRVVASDELLATVWPSAALRSAHNALHTHISRLRGHLGSAAERLEAVAGGYRLALSNGELDAAEAQALLGRAREMVATPQLGRGHDEAGAPDPAGARALLRQAQALWRGPVLADLADVAPLAAWATALEELRHEVDAELIMCSLAAGELDGVVGLATEAAARDPLREPAVLLLMRALAASGRAAEALRTGYDYRRLLVQETGLDPTPALERLERAIAGGDVGPAAPGTVAGQAGAPAAAAAPAARDTGAPARTAGAPAARDTAPAPAPAPRLHGRDAEVAALKRLVARERLTTVIGPAGVGKTRTALEIARHADNASILLLAPVTDPSALPDALAATLELHVARDDALTACIALLGAGPRLLLIDNCEHLTAAVAELVALLVDRCPELSVLATSRAPLGLPTERLFRLAPLPLPGDDEAAGLASAPAVRIFLDRARKVRAGFAPRPDELRVIADIVRQLEGMPLAIELAAGRMSSLDVADLHARIDRALDLLGDEHARPDGRHRTLRATIAWSYDLLSADEQLLLRHLSVFPDGVDLGTAEQVASAVGVQADPARVIARLVDASMLEASLDGRARYRMLDTLRAFGLDRLAHEHEEGAAAKRLVEWAVELAQWIDATVTTEHEPAADTTLRREVGNLRAAWHHLRRDARLDDAVTLVMGLADASYVRDLPEVWGWGQELAGDGALEGHPRAGAVLGAAAAGAWMLGDLERSERLAEQAWRTAEDDQGRWWALSGLSNAYLIRGRHADAVAVAVEAAGCWQRPTESYGIAGLGAAYAGDLDEARAYNDRLAAAAESPTLQALNAYVAGEIESTAGYLGLAEEHYVRAIDLARQSGATFVVGIASVGLQTVRVRAGRVTDALRGYLELIEYWQHAGNWLQQWTTLRNVAGLLDACGDPETAVFLRLAADHAPGAPAVTDPAGAVTYPAGASDPSRAEATEAASLPAGGLTRVRAEAVAATRAEVLAVARDALSRQLAAHR